MSNLEELECLVQPPRGGLEHGEEVREAEVGHFVHEGIDVDLEGADGQGNVASWKCLF